MRSDEPDGVHMLALVRALLNGPSELQESTSRGRAQEYLPISGVHRTVAANIAIISVWPVSRRRPTSTARIGDYIVRTARNRALPSTTRSYAFGASTSGYVSTIVLTFPCATKSSAS